ncbi:unnamed protein product [Rotaria sordida]|uniref:Calmodulin-lysine N-methyltransferase n=1 Tax=Rotaria sordida TaxID=392033 RepID=A0A819FXP6_9BILA|nr:unnamed protein product [Rotaria sordida]CAF3872701.1 unnamed protein product [Rotaria sordida]
MTTLARQRWRMLGEILLSKNLQTSFEHDDISVMRFKTFGLYVRSSLKSTDEDDGTWCLLEFPSFEDNQSNIISLDIRLCSTKIDYADLIGFNNTGNTCIWPSEEVLAFYCLKGKEIFENKSVCELGGGMTCLAGLAVNLNAILRSKNNQVNWLCPIESRVLIWTRQLNDPNLKQRFDFIISADCFFFEDLHHDLCHTIYYMLKDSGVAINFAPYRSKSLNRFVSIAERYSFECSIFDHYDEDVFNKHLQAQQINKHYSSDLHYPILVILRKRQKTDQ